MKRLVLFLGLIAIIMMFGRTVQAYQICNIPIEYSPGTYFTDNGGPCTDHSTKGIHSSTNEAACNCKCTYNGHALGATQCFGFARYMQVKLFGYNSYEKSNSFYKVSGSSIPARSLNVNNLKKVITSSGIGSHIRINKTASTSYGHSMIITGISEDGFSIIDCNSDGHCKVDARTYTWSGYVQCKYGSRGFEYIEEPIDNPYRKPIQIPDPVPPKEFQYFVEGPEDGATYTDSVSMGGWVIFGTVIHSIVLYINDQPVCECSTVSRPDVASVYPEYSTVMGFSCVADASQFREGQNSIFFRAITYGSMSMGYVNDFGHRTINFVHPKVFEAIVDVPQNGQNCTGFLDIGGWAVSEEKVAEVVLCVNGQEACSLPMHERADVAEIFPQYTTGNDGFFLHVNGSKYFSNGANNIFFRAYSQNRGKVLGEFGHRTINYTVQKPFQGHLDTPTDGMACSGFVQMQGWAVYGEGISEVVLYVNDQPVCNCAKFERTDVAAAYPGYPAGKEGFKCRVNGNAVFREGENKIHFRAYTNNNADVLEDFGYCTINYTPAKPFQAVLDTPADGAACSGLVQMQGWSVYGEGVSSVVMYVNGQQACACELFERTDVADANPGYPKGNEGFRCAVNGNDVFREGENTIFFRAFTNDGADVIGDFGQCRINYTPVKQFQAVVDTPSDGQDCTGVVPMQGWAVYGDNISDIVLFANDKPVCSCERFVRQDVADALKGYPTGSEGFKCTVNGNQVFKSGDNTIFFRAYAEDGKTVVADFGKRVIKYTPQKQFTYYIESPSVTEQYSGYVTMKGWAVYGEGVADVMLYVNDQFVCKCEKSERADVAQEYPDYPKGSEGFSCRIYGNDVFKEGENTICFKAFTSDNTFIEDFGQQTLMYTAQEPFRWYVEGPDDGESYSGNVEVGGWAVYKEGIAKVELFLNDQSAGACKLESREDVAQTYTGYPAGKEGFSITIPAEKMKEGENKLYFRAYTEGQEEPVETFGNRTINYVVNAEESGETETIDIAASSVTLSETSYVYDGMLKRPNPTVVCDGVTLKRNIDYTVTYFNHRNAGNAVLIVKGKGKYTGGIVKPFVITKANQKINAGNMEIMLGTESNISVVAIGEVTYFSDDETVVKVDADGTVYPISIGTAHITIKATGNSNYNAAEKKIDVTVKKQVLSDLNSQNALLEYAICEYDGQEKQPKVKITYGDMELNESEDYSVTYTNNVDVGEATVFINGKGNYTGTLTQSFRIDQTDQMIQSEDETSLSVGETVRLSATGYGEITFKSDDESVATVNNQGVVKATGFGTANITVEASGDEIYRTAQKVITISVSKRQLNEDTAVIHLNDEGYISNGEEIKPEVIVFYDTALLKENKDYQVSYKNNVEAGEAEVIITGIGDYEGTCLQTFTIVDEQAMIEEPDSDTNLDQEEERKDSATTEQQSGDGDKTTEPGSSQEDKTTETGSSQEDKTTETGSDREDETTGTGSGQETKTTERVEVSQEDKTTETGSGQEDKTTAPGSSQEDKTTETASGQEDKTTETGSSQDPKTTEERDTQDKEKTTENVGDSQTTQDEKPQTKTEDKPKTGGTDVKASTEQQATVKDKNTTEIKTAEKPKTTEQSTSRTTTEEIFDDDGDDEEEITPPSKVVNLKLQATSKKRLKVTFKKVSGADGYQIFYSTSKKFPKNKTYTAKIRKNSYVLKKLKSKKKYYVKVRAFKTDDDGEKIYGKYSAVRVKKVK